MGIDVLTEDVRVAPDGIGEGVAASAFCIHLDPFYARRIGPPLPVPLPRFREELMLRA